MVSELPSTLQQQSSALLLLALVNCSRAGNVAASNHSPETCTSTLALLMNIGISLGAPLHGRLPSEARRCNDVQTQKRFLCTHPAVLGRPVHVHQVSVRCRKRHRSVATDSPSTGVGQGSKPENLVDELLDSIKNSDSGIGLQEDEEASVNSLINQLENVGRQQEPRPLDNSLIFGNFGVAFSSTQQAPKQSGQPAGGGFRSKPGRLVFQTRDLCQSIFKPNLATNKVSFALLGCISGSIGLRGTFVPEGDKQDTVKVDFEPPRLSLPGGINLAVGPTSSVVLSTTYLDERVRLGKGGRGSSFVFTRGGPCDHAGMEDVGLGRTTLPGYAILFTLAAAFCGTAFRLLQSGTLWSKIVAAPPALLGVAIVFGLWLNVQFSKKPSKQS